MKCAGDGGKCRLPHECTDAYHVRPELHCRFVVGPTTGVRFYVWRKGWSVCSAWRVVAPSEAGISDLTDCTDMSGVEFDNFVTPMLEDERRYTVPGGGNAGDPGYF